MKSKATPPDKLYKFRRNISVFTLAGLLIPFILQQTFYPFFRFGMFAEPVKRKIQTEQFFLADRQENGKYNIHIVETIGVHVGRLDYLLRNYYYRNEADQFLLNVSQLFPTALRPDTLFILRKLEADTTIVARFPKL